MTNDVDPSTGILADVRVLDLAEGGAGSLAASLLADYGADVVKVLPNDPRLAPDADLPEWLVGNRTKRLAIGTPQVEGDRAEVGRLARSSDIIVADSAARLREFGLEAEELSDAHLVVITPAYDIEGAPWFGGKESNGLLEAVTGLASYQASYSGSPVSAVYPYLIRLHGLWAATCSVAALTEFRHSGNGQMVAIDGLHAAAVFGDSPFTRPEDEPDADRGIGPEGLNPMYTRYQGADGNWVFVGGLGPKFANTVVDVVDLRELLDDPRIGGRIDRLWHIDNSRWVLDRFQERFRSRTATEWVALLEENDVPTAFLGRREDWFRSEQMQAMHQRLLQVDPVLGEVELTGAIIESTNNPANIKVPARTTTIRQTAWHADPRKPAVAQHPAEDGQGPLAGRRAVVFGSYVAGPYVGRLLAELGMDAIKVEPLGGDPWRMQGFGINRGYRSIALDLTGKSGRDALKHILASSDVVVDNFRAGVTERLGLSHTALARLKSDIVSVSVTAYGERGPLSHKPGYDPVVQAISGMMLAQGGDDEPVAFSLPPNDLVTAVAGAFAAVLGTYHVTMTGHGQHLSTALATTAVFLQAGDLVTYPNRPMGRNGGRDFPGPTAIDRFYPVADGHVRIQTDALVPELWNAAGLPLETEALKEDPAAEIARVLSSHTRSQAVSLLTAAGVPAAPSRSLREVTLDAALHDNQILGRFTASDGQRFVTTNRLADFSRTPVKSYFQAPGLGEHSLELLRQFGADEQTIRELVLANTVIDGEPAAITYLPPYR